MWNLELLAWRIPQWAKNLLSRKENTSCLLSSKYDNTFPSKSPYNSQHYRVLCHILFVWVFDHVCPSWGTFSLDLVLFIDVLGFSHLVQQIIYLRAQSMQKDDIMVKYLPTECLCVSQKVTWNWLRCLIVIEKDKDLSVIIKVEILFVYEKKTKGPI